MNPVITKMKHFGIIANGFYSFAIVAKSFHFKFCGFLDPPMHCNKFAAKAVGWFKPNRMGYVCMHTLGESI